MCVVYRSCGWLCRENHWCVWYIGSVVGSVVELYICSIAEICNASRNPIRSGRSKESLLCMKYIHTV